MVYILLADGFEEVEAVSPADALRRARVEVQLVGVTGMTVTASHGLRVAADAALADIDPASCEALIVPGGLRGVENLKASPGALAAIQTAYDAGRLVCAICAGPTVLARLGILEGKKAVCYPGMEGELTGADVKAGARAVTDGQVITGRSAGTSWDFALAILTALRGPEAAQKVAGAIHYDGFQG